MRYYIEKQPESVFANGVLSIEERTLLMQLDGQSKKDVLEELEQMQDPSQHPESDMVLAAALVQSLKEKILNHPHMDIQEERSMYSPMF